MDVQTPRGCTHYKLRQIARRVGRDYDAVLAAAGLKTSQYSMLNAIARFAPVRPGDLAARMGLDASTLTRNLAPLVAAGWVSVGPGENLRTRSVELTDAGRAKLDEARRQWKSAQQALNARLGTERVAQLHALIDDCLALLDAPDEETLT